MSPRLVRFGTPAVILLALATTAAVQAQDAHLPDATHTDAAERADHESIGHAGGVNTDAAEIRRDLAIYTFIVFLVLLAILWRFAWGPVVAALDAREQHIENSLAEAERARDQAKALLAEHDKKLAEVQNEVRAILDEARRDAQTTQQEILKQAQAEAQATRDRAKREIGQARDQALKELFDRAGELATELASRIIQRSLSPQDHRDLVQKALNELPSKN